jgi:Avidin family
MGLTGTWKNELNSIMVLKENSDHSIIGKYLSFAGKDPHPRALAGRTHAPKTGEKQMLSFSVCFEIEDPAPGNGHFAVGAWSGWLKKTNEGKEIVDTFWVLSSSKLDPKDEWSSHLVGEDIFEKISESDDDSNLKALLGTS